MIQCRHALLIILHRGTEILHKLNTLCTKVNWDRLPLLQVSWSICSTRCLRKLLGFGTVLSLLFVGRKSASLASLMSLYRILQNLI